MYCRQPIVGADDGCAAVILVKPHPVPARETGLDALGAHRFLERIAPAEARVGDEKVEVVDQVGVFGRAGSALEPQDLGEFAHVEATCQDGDQVARCILDRRPDGHGRLLQ